MSYERDDGFLGILLFFSPNKWGILFCEIKEWCSDDGKVSAKHVMVSCTSQESSYLFEVVEGSRVFSESSDFGRIYCDAVLGYSYSKEVHLRL
jgi:hypothetical protein